MAWLVLVVSGVLEAVWATALGRSEGFSRIVPTVVFGVALVLSMAGLAFAMRDLPVKAQAKMAAKIAARSAAAL